ncbi:MAG TPA: hypothetical protein PLU67_07530 [Candidatus Kapabacteria bacterium]|nr:hypothetical protein [Candidatus Kapabacteria bacterium]HPP40172.1 hypothetical protein [Candidatus Kapabacteria bacterium]HPU23533.1 hypothetical protein [Candidatus Kapabacteria bacterium]
MKKIDNFGSISGRRLLQDIFKSLRYEKQWSSFAALIATWRLATREIDLEQYTNEDVQIIHSLGFWRGTAVWLEEIVNRFYFSTINSFAYFGAAILLVLVGVRRFSDHVSDEIVIAGILFEAALLLFLFFIMLFTPNEEIASNDQREEFDFQKELLNEVGEISRDFAATTMQLENLTEKLNALISLQNEALAQISSIAKSFLDISQPNPEFVKILQQTNHSLLDFNDKIKLLNENISQIKQEEIKIAIRNELEQILSNKLARNEKQ